VGIGAPAVQRLLRGWVLDEQAPMISKQLSGSTRMVATIGL
jgi:hypothetical protein